MDNQKIDQWIKKTKHLQGRHDQQTHGNRGVIASDKNLGEWFDKAGLEVADSGKTPDGKPSVLFVKMGDGKAGMKKLEDAIKNHAPANVELLALLTAPGEPFADAVFKVTGIKKHVQPVGSNYLEPGSLSAHYSAANQLEELRPEMTTWTKKMGYPAPKNPIDILAAKIARDAHGLGGTDLSVIVPKLLDLVPPAMYLGGNNIFRDAMKYMSQFGIKAEKYSYTNKYGGEATGYTLSPEKRRKTPK